MHTTKNYIYHLIAILTVGIWGLTFISTKVLIEHGLSPQEIFLLRFLMAYLGIWFISPRKLFADNWKDELWLLWGGVTGGSFYFFTENTALEITLATNVAFIVCTAPLGDFLTLLAAFSWAFYSLIMKKMSGRYRTTFITRKIFFYGILTILPAFILHPWQFSLSGLWQPAVWMNLLFLGVLASLVCFVVWNIILKQLGTVRASNYIYLNPLFTLIGSAVLLDEQFTVMSLMGAMLILGGVYWAGKR